MTARAERELTRLTVDSLSHEIEAKKLELRALTADRKRLARKIAALEREVAAAKQVRSLLLQDHMPEETR